MTESTNTQGAQDAADITALLEPVPAPDFEKENLRVSLTNAEARIDNLLANLRASQVELRNFKAKVRAVALQVRADEGWCRDGFNSAMDELGLEGLPSHFEVEVTVTATQTVTVRVPVEDLDSEDEDEARDYVRNNEDDIVVNALDSSEWEIQETEVDSVDPITE